jgi:ribonuclease J
MTPKNELLFCGLGGSGEIGMNVNLYGCQGKWVMVDLGITFADPQYPGVDVILPDLSFIEDRIDDLLGIVITHGHEDISARCRTSPKTSACRSMRRRSRWA